MDGLCISGTKGAAYSQSLTKGTASVLYRAKRTAFEEGLSAEWDAVDGLCPEQDGHGLCLAGPRGLEKRTR